MNKSDIISAQWADQGRTIVQVTTAQGMHMIPLDANNLDQQELSKWLSDGNTIASYSAPPRSRASEVSGRPIIAALIRAIAPRLGTTEAQVKADVEAEL